MVNHEQVLHPFVITLLLSLVEDVVVKIAYLSTWFIPIHDWHVKVQEDEVIKPLVGNLLILLDKVESFLAIFSLMYYLNTTYFLKGSRDNQ